jgi:hypothetical protein
MSTWRRSGRRPAWDTLLGQAFKQSLQTRSDVELNLGAFVGTVLAEPGDYPTR